MKRIFNVLKNNKHWYLLFLSLIVFLFILINVLNENTVKFDKKIYNAIISIKSDYMTNIFKVITEFGDATILIIITIIFLIILKNKKMAITVVLNLSIFPLLNVFLKNIIKRPRPVGYRLIEESGYSFPSGHSMASMAFYGLIIYYVLKNVKNKTVRNIICTSLSILIILIGTSRIYLGVHYATDVIAGFLVSIVYLVIYITIILKLNKTSNEEVF